MAFSYDVSQGSLVRGLGVVVVQVLGRTQGPRIQKAGSKQVLGFIPSSLLGSIPEPVGPECA